MIKRKINKSLKKLSKKSYKKKNKILFGGNPPSEIETGNPKWKIEYYPDISDLISYLKETPYESERPSCVYVTIGSKSPSSSLPDDTKNSQYQIIPGFFDDYNGKLFIIMLDMFYKSEPGEQRKNDFEVQGEIIKKRLSELSINPNLSVHLIMCNLHLAPYIRDISTDFGREARSQFIGSYTKFANCLYSILHFTYDKLELETSQFLLCNFIRFKRANLYDNELLLNSNSLINWMLGGEAGGELIKTISNDSLPLKRYEGRGILTNKHYIWAGYTFYNLIYKYIDFDMVQRFSSASDPQIKQCNYINFSDYKCYDFKDNPKSPLYKLFLPFTINIGGVPKPINFRFIDLTISYPTEMVLHDDNPNICENL